MSENPGALDYRSLSLVGVVQSAELVDARAHGKDLPAGAAAAVKNAVLTHQAQSLGEVFPDPTALREGVASALSAFENAAANPRVLGYTLQLIELAAKLKKDRAVLDRLTTGLERLSAQPGDAELAEVYQNSISLLGQRIHVKGEPAILQQDSAAAEIRALLLAGVRFAWLWLQLGGRRWHLLLRRRSLLESLQELRRALNIHLTVH